MATLVAKTRAITHSTTNETSNDQVIEFLNDGTAFVISHIPKELLRPYSSETSFTSSTGIASNNNVILGVRRGNYEAMKVDKSEAGWLESSSGSYMIPTNEFPKWYERNGTIFLKPNPTTSTAGFMDSIIMPTLTSASASVLGNLEHIVIDQASGYDYKALGSYYANSARTEIGLANTEIGKAITEIGLANAEIDKMAAQTALADAELDEAAVNVDANVDTATAAIATACGRINTAVQLANAEFDKCTTLLSLGEADSEGEVNTALAAIVTELAELPTIADTMHTEMAKVVVEIAEAISLTDSTSSDILTALTGLNAAIDQYTAASGDPSVFGNETLYLTATPAIAKVKTALDSAIAYIDTDADAWQTDEDSEMLDGAIKMARSQIEVANAQLSEFTAIVQTLQSSIQGWATEIKSRIEFVNSKATVWNGILAGVQGYGNEIQTKIAIANGYANEAKTRLEQAGTKREESKSRIELGMAYLQEANTAIAETQAYVNEVDARLKQVQAQIAIAQGYIGTATSYMNAAQGYIATANGYHQNAAGYIQTAQGYIGSVNQYYVEGDKMFNKATQEVETYIKNSSEMITVQAGSK